MQLRVQGRISMSYTEQDAVVAAVVAGDAEAAAAKLRDHVIVQDDRFYYPLPSASPAPSGAACPTNASAIANCSLVGWTVISDPGISPTQPP